MDISEHYVVYGLNKVLGSNEHLALEKVDFYGMDNNSFETEKEAIEALINNNMTFEDYVILKQVYLRAI